MELGNLIIKELLEADKVYDKMFSGAGFIAQFIFYPIALDLAQERNEITEVANLIDKSEYKIFRMFGDKKMIDSQFGEYLKKGCIPPLIRQECRNYLKSH
tara:strand:+ start:587 stop:886 length:300 start_codon:yes stop_codon:yes gene_type:complete